VTVTTPQLPVAFELHAEPGLTGGVYANNLIIWHTAHEFTLDFSVNSKPPQAAQTEDGTEVISVPHELVARVRIPPSLVFDVIRTINEAMTGYEAMLGPIPRPGEQDTPLYPPADLGDTGTGPPPQD
jgi:hypothetical protein